MNYCLVWNCSTPTKLFVCEEHESLNVGDFMAQTCMLCGEWGAMGRKMLCDKCRWQDLTRVELERFQQSCSRSIRYLRPGYALSEVVDVLERIEVLAKSHNDETPINEESVRSLDELSIRLRKEIASIRGWIAYLNLAKWVLTVIGAPSLILWVNLCTGP